MTPRLTVVVLTKNSMGVIRRLTDSLARQAYAGPWELLFMDNASQDGTPEFLAGLPFAGARIIHVPEGEFSHSRTRMQAAGAAKGELVAFLTDDIVPAGEDFLEALVRPVADGRADAAYGVHQVHPEWHDPIDASLHNDWSADYGDVSQPVDEYTWRHLAPAMRRRLSNFDNCASCIRRDVLMDVRFPDVPYGEDMLFAKRLIRSGRRVALARRALFFHWHRVRFGYLVKRMCIDARLSRDEFGLLYVSRLLAVPKEILKRILHRTWVGLFRLRGVPLHRRLYWILYNARVLTADFIGKYMGTLDDARLGGPFSFIKKPLYRRQRRIIEEIERRSIRRY